MQRVGFHLGVAVCAVLAFGVAGQAQRPAGSPPEPNPARGMQIASSGGYPELRVDGKPFFVHSASFFYYRIPRDLWEKSLDAHAALGINTIDLYIPWNWHEPREGEFDFDGHSHPRRDLRGLLELIQKKGFRLIARPGPVILNEWRHGGYPEWLLERPEYGMELADRLEGRYPPLANLNARDAEAAAKGWLENATHMAYARKWLARVAAELAPYSVHRVHRQERPAGKRNQPPQVMEFSGPLLFVQLDDDLAIGRGNYAGPEFWRYVQELRAMVVAGGVDVPVFINPFDPRVAAAGSAQPHPVGVMGQWYLRPDAAPRREHDLPQSLRAADVSAIEFLARSLATQPAFPPLMIEYNAGWYTPFDDERVLESPRENTLASSRLLIAGGLGGYNHFPLQDSLAPAGYEVPWSNRHFRWDAALDVNSERRPRARSVQRTGQLLPLWGEFLAASHPRVDFAVVNPTGALPQEALAREDAISIAVTVNRLLRLATAAGLSAAMLDAHHQPPEQLLRHPLILLPVFPQSEEKFRLSEPAQRVLVEYVRHGGTLVWFPERPRGEAMAELWSGAATESGNPASVISRFWRVGQGNAIESTKDFYSWVHPEENLKDTRSRMEAVWAFASLRELMGRAGLHAVIERYESAIAAEELYVSQRVSNDGTLPLGRRTGGRGLASVVNLAADGVAEAKLRFLSPRDNARPSAAERIELPVSVPAGEALLLPLHFPLCSEARPSEKCDDEIIAAGAELLSVYRDGRSLELLFYTPSRANLIFRFAEQPRRVRVDDLGVDGVWVVEARRFTVEILRGAAPHYLRTVRVDLRHRPFVSDKPKDPQGRRDFDSAVTSAMRLPLAADAGLAADPPLILLDEDGRGTVVVEALNYDELGARVSLRVDGPVRASSLLALEAGERGYERLDLRPERSTPGLPPPGEVVSGQLRLRGFGEERVSPLRFVRLAAKGSTAYRYDFDRDGAEEWVLEDAHLRAIVSPEAGGRVVALVSKHGGLNLTNSVGALRDHFDYAENPPGRLPARARGAAGLFNRHYRAGWLQEEAGPALRLAADAPDVYPAGARVEKTIRLHPRTETSEQPAANTRQVAEAREWGGLDVEYNVSLAPAAIEQPQPQAFVAVHSVPALLRGDRTTRFCWLSPGTELSSEEGVETCELFQPGGRVTVPEGVTGMTVRTPGAGALRLEWSEGTMAVEMKNYSALLKLQFPPLAPGGAAGQYRLRMELRDAE